MKCKNEDNYLDMYFNIPPAIRTAGHLLLQSAITGIYYLKGDSISASSKKVGFFAAGFFSTVDILTAKNPGIPRENFLVFKIVALSSVWGCAYLVCETYK